MSSRNIVLLIVGLVMVFTLVGLRNYFSAPEEEAAPIEQAKRALIAKHDMAVGAFVQPPVDLDWKVLTEEEFNNPMMKDSYMLEGQANPMDYSGALVRRSMRAGETVTPNAMMKAGEGGFMSAVLEPGKRAVSIAVNPTSGNAGFVVPGDHIDLMVTHRIKAGGTKENAGDELVVTETFAHNIRVLAADQELNNPENKAIMAKTITVEVSPRQAEAVSVASEMGKISVSLVSNSVAHKEPAKPESDIAPAGEAAAMPASPETTEGKIANVFEPDAIAQPKEYEKYTRDGDVSSMLGRKESSLSRVRVIRGDATETLEFYQEK